MIFLLDAGHGGIINGVYQTAGKRSPDFGKGVYFEGVGNRDIVERISIELFKENIAYEIITPENEDISLKERVKRVNDYCDKFKDKVCLLISVHSDAFTNEKANGWSVYTSKGQTKSDYYATIFFNEAKSLLPCRTFRFDNSDGDPDKEADFYILKNTKCPAILTENFFMTNPQDYELLMSSTGRQLIADAHVNAIKRIVNEVG